MAHILQLSIKNFRSLKDFQCSFNNAKMVCLIGRGDSGKTTILDAISYVLYPSWNLQVSDYDFTDLDVTVPISITAILTCFPDDFLRDDKYGLYLSGYDLKNSTVTDYVDDGSEPVLVVEFSVDSSLEPKWEIVNHTSGLRTTFSAKDRARLNVCYVSDFVNKHFGWGSGSPLSTLSKLDGQEIDNDIVLEMMRNLRNSSTEAEFGNFEETTARIKETATQYGLDIGKLKPAFDAKMLSIRDGAVTLHDERKLPLRLMGKGSRRLLSVAIQSCVAGNDGITLIDELEQGLEPDRARTFARCLKHDSNCQHIFTTHSDNVLVEVEAKDLFLVRKGKNTLQRMPDEVQKLLRKSPGAFFCKKIILCEGPTEIGFCKGISQRVVRQGGKPLSCQAIALADGGGSELINYAKLFRAIDFEVILFCDSDEEKTNSEKVNLTSFGVKIVDWDEGDSFEQGVFKGMPSSAIRSLIDIGFKWFKLDEENEAKRRDSFCDGIRAKLPQITQEMVFNDTDYSPEQRSAMALVAKSKKGAWFKRESAGLDVARAVFACVDHGELVCNESNRLWKNIKAITVWCGVDGVV